MDGEQFDALLRKASGDSPRRGVLRAGLGIVAATALGLVGLNHFDQAEARSTRAERRRARKQKKKKAKQGPPGPPGPGGPTGPAGPPQTCANGQPFNCGNGCCNDPFPLCCPAADVPSQSTCASAGNVCCPVAFGGYYCRAGEECCPPAKRDLFGGCADLQAGEHCCGAGSGGFCEGDEDCCPPAVTNSDNKGCCPTGVPCCNADGDCTGTFNHCDIPSGCCETVP